MASSSAAPCVLNVENDPGLNALLQTLLTEEGYGVACASSLPQALALTQEQAFNGIFTTLFPQGERDPLQSIEPLRVQAYPTPIGVLSRYFVPQTETEQRGYASVLELPFRIEEALQVLASWINRSFSAERAHQAQHINEYLDALLQQDWERVRHLCLPSVQYIHLTPIPFTAVNRLEGIDRVLAYLQEARQQLPGYRLEHCVVVEQRNELVARYGCSWLGRDGQRQSLAELVVFRLVGEQIAQIGVTVNQHRMRALLANTAAR